MGNSYYQGPKSDHFDGERFFHPGLASADKGLRDILRWRFLGKRSAWPAIVPARSGVRPAAQVESLQITMIGHASVLLQVSGSNILLDPVWSERASPFPWIGPMRHNPPAVAFEDLPPIDSVLVTHNHYDHMDVVTLERLWDAYRPYTLSPLGNDTVIRSSASQVEVTTGDWWDSFMLPQGIRATIVPAYHWSSRWIGDRRKALWGGFVLETAAGVIYCAGDTAYRDGKIFSQIRERFGPPVVAILPIGAYDPRWFMRTQHADPAEAVQIARDLGARHMLGVHWNTFLLTDEPFDEPEKLLDAAAVSQPAGGVAAVALHPGDVWTLE